MEQQALYTLKLYRSLNIADVSVTMPEVDGLAFAKLGEPREYQGVLQGRPYQIIEVRYLVTPQKAGMLTLTPTRMDLTVFTPQNRPRRGVFDDPFFGQAASGRRTSLTSEALAFQVLPLPLEGRPADFGGLVGSFTLEATLEPQQLKAGESRDPDGDRPGPRQCQADPGAEDPDHRRPQDLRRPAGPEGRDRRRRGHRCQSHEVGARARAGGPLQRSRRS